MSNRVLIILQENSGQVALPDFISGADKKAIYAVIDKMAESFEKVSASLNTAGLYLETVDLSDTACTRQNLVNALVDHTLKNHAIDLVVLGHGNVDTLSLHGGERLTGGATGNIRTILAEAQARGCPHINLHMVYMCNCQGSSLNDDWLAIGAKVSIGTLGDNYMPEPMTGIFLAHWSKGSSAKEAAQASYYLSIPVWTPFYLPGPGLEIPPPPAPPFPVPAPNAKIKSSCPIIAGDGNRTAAMNEVISLPLDVGWDRIGHANDVVAMAAINGKLFAATRDNRLWWRDPVGQDVNWNHIGHANDVVAMAAINGKLFAATRDNRLSWRDPVGQDVNWDRIGHANDVVAMAAINGKLFAATRDNRLSWRDPVGQDVNWDRIGHANDVVAMAAINNKLFCATRDNRLWWRDPVGQDVNWDHIGHANDVVAMAAINGKLFAATRDNRLSWRDPVR